MIGLRPNLVQYPFTARSFALSSGHNLSYLDEGSGPVVVMVHGNPSWSYLYRNLVTALQAGYRCIVPDHIGCGLSDKPLDYPYRLANHIANLTELLAYLDIEQCVMVVHDWGGAIGMGWAGSHARQIDGLVVLNTAAFLSTHIPLRIAICRWPLIGSLLVRGLNGFAWPATFMAVHNKMKPEVASAFINPYNNWQNRVAVHRFVQDIPMEEDHPSRQTLLTVEKNLAQLQDKPMLICWGGEDFCFNDHFYEQWQQRFPDAETLYLPEAGHYVLEDGLEAVLERLNPFLAACNSSPACND